MIKDVRAAVARSPSFPPVLFVYQATRLEGQPFFDSLWKEARAIADPQHIFFRAFHLERARLGQMVGVRPLARAVCALWKGNGAGRPVGDPLLMPGAFLVQRERVLWTHPFRHVGDHPDFASIAGMAERLAR